MEQQLARFWEQVMAAVPEVQKKLERRSAAWENLPPSVQGAVSDKCVLLRLAQLSHWRATMPLALAWFAEHSKGTNS